MKKILFLLVCFLTCNCYSYAQQITSLPTLRINTENGAPINSKEDYVQAKLTIESCDQSECMVDTKIEIKGWGNSTGSMAKKPYQIKFNSKTKLLNMDAKAKNWVLLANYADKTLIRNAVTPEVGRFVGMGYTPPVRFIDVILNGEYLGSYTATDQTEVEKDRIPAEEQETTTTVNNPQLTCYPGIATDKITLTLPGNQETMRAELYSITGRKVQSEVVNSQNTVINISRLHPGVYIVKIADKPYCTKFIKR